jgi:hypothetical protein
MAESKVRLVERDKMKPGDVLKYVDTLTLEERAELDALRRLDGNSGVLDIRASMLEDLAVAARKQASAAKLFETYPSMFPELPEKPNKLAAAQVFVMALVLCGMIALAVFFGRIHQPTLSAQDAPKAAPEAGEVVQTKPPTQKGRVR